MDAKVKIPERVKRAVKRFEQASRDHELLGSHDPEDWDDIRKEFQDARAALFRVIADEMRRSCLTERARYEVVSKPATFVDPDPTRLNKIVP